MYPYIVDRPYTLFSKRALQVIPQNAMHLFRNPQMQHNDVSLHAPITKALWQISAKRQVQPVPSPHSNLAWLSTYLARSLS